MYSQLSQDASIKIVSVSREGETMPIAAGLWAGGKKPVVMIQNTGLFESGDSIRGMTIDLKFPLVIFVGYRGWKRKSKITDSAAKFTTASHCEIKFCIKLRFVIFPFTY